MLDFEGRQPSEKSNIEFTEEEAALNQQSGNNLVDSAVKISMEAALQGKPKRSAESYIRFIFLMFTCQSICTLILVFLLDFPYLTCCFL
jgi:hypothetical protein